MIPFGIIARTQEDFGGAPVIAELTQHQLVVATVLASSKTLFYAGLLHDILKPALRFVKSESGGWKWWHLNYNMEGKEIPLRDYLQENQAISKLGINEESLLEVIQCHHPNPWCKKKKLLKRNPINYVEGKLGITSMEATILPSKGLENIGMHVCLEVKGLKHPYHYFVLSVIYHGMKHYLNKLYGEIFSKLGLERLIVEYYFGEYNLPIIEYEESKLTIKYFISSSQFKGLHIRHEYGSNLKFNVNLLKEGGVGFTFGWSDVLVYMIPYANTTQYSYRIACVIPGLVTYDYDKGKIDESSNSKTVFKDKVMDITFKVIDELEKNLNLETSYGGIDIIDYLEGQEQGDYNCLFCGKQVATRIKLGRSGLLSEKFTDYHRISGIIEGRKVSVCPLCHIGFIMEEKFRKQGPSFLVPLAGEPTEVEVSKDFTDRFLSKYKDIPISTREGVILSVLGYSTLQLISNAWYQSLLREVGRLPITIPWINAYNVRSQRDIDALRFGFLITREVLLYPLVIKVRPKAIISSYGGRNKKFVLNTDLLEGHVLWRGEEHDLTEEHLDALKPLLVEISKSKIKRLRKLYSRVVNLYGLQ